ncbi:iron complex transport system substrate-binding protein [Agrobacterium vitis]|nr:iron complex transport system substrate-binding protein [Agrobacterium vitis]MBE1436522.1 iron complex transport system substrate-binding protein [Agrobacterium vitis]
MKNTLSVQLKAQAAIMMGFIVIFAAPLAIAEEHRPSKIVAIGGSVTEIVYALGEEQRLVGRDSTSIYPPEARKLPDTGYIRALSPEGVLSLTPDLILMLQGAGPPEALETLKAAGVSLVTIPDGYDAASISQKVEAVGAALGVDEKAHALAARLDASLKAVLAKNGAPEHKARVLFVLSLQSGRIMAAGAQNHADGIIKLAGGENVMADIHGYKQVSDEAIIKAAPDVIVMMTGTGGHSVDDQTVLDTPAIASTPAGKAKRLVRMDGMYLLGFGPRTAEAVQTLHTALYPDSGKTE